MTSEEWHFIAMATGSHSREAQEQGDPTTVVGTEAGYMSSGPVTRHPAQATKQFRISASLSVKLVSKEHVQYRWLKLLRKL